MVSLEKKKTPPTQGSQTKRRLHGTYTDLKKCLLQRSTKEELASLKLLLRLTFTLSLTLHVRLSVNAVTNCYKILDKASDEDEEVGVEIGALGIFKSSSVRLWKRACYATSPNWKMKVELN